MAIEVLRELYQVVERQDGAVFRTKYIKDVWVDPDEDPGLDFQYVVKSDPDVVSIRRKSEDH